MIHSMTAFASRTGAASGASWVWEVRSVNARGLDLRLRLPEGIEGLEAAIRQAFGTAMKRGNISLSLRVSFYGTAQDLALDEAQLDRVLGALDRIQERAFAMGVTLGQPTAADVLTQRGVVLQGQTQEIDASLVDAIKSDIDPLLQDLVTMRATEGAALSEVITKQIDEVDRLVTAAAAAVIDRRPSAVEALKAGVARILAEAEADPERLAQEYALLAVKTDVTEEIDRLKTHVAAARDLLAEAQSGDAPLGRKFDFLSQEFNREANTLCAKSQYAPLTAIGLDLKTVIDQMREQIQNVE